MEEEIDASRLDVQYSLDKWPTVDSTALSPSGMFF